MTRRATTSLSLHYQVKPGQKEEVLVEIKGVLDLCAKEPEFIMAIVHETPDRPNEFVFYELLAGKIERILIIPTVMIQGGSDFCDEPSSSEGFDRYFDGGYRRLLL